MEKDKQRFESEFYLSMESVVTKTVKLMENQVCEHDGNFLKSGIKNLDFCSGDFAILCGRSGSKKTAFALNIVNNLSVKKQIPVGYISCGKIDTENFGKRLVSLNSKVPLRKMQTLNLDEDDLEKIKKACHKLSESPLFFVDLPNSSFCELATSATFLKDEQNVKFIVVDSFEYLQDILDSDKADFRSTLEELLNNFKKLAKNLKIPILVLLNLPLVKMSENVDNFYSDCFTFENGIKKYMIIQRKADIVMFLHRNEDFNDSDFSAPTYSTYSLEIIKNNHGKTCLIQFSYDSQIMKFSAKDNS